MTKYTVFYFLKGTPYQERIEVSSSLDFIDGSGEAMERVKACNPTATDFSAEIY